LIPGLPAADTTTTPADVPQTESGMPKWVIPVGIGIAGIGLVYFLTRKK
jgi:hypothetical protein